MQSVLENVGQTESPRLGGLTEELAAYRAMGGTCVRQVGQMQQRSKNWVLRSFDLK